MKIFAWQTGICIIAALCGLRPHPASGIRLGFSGNNTNAEGIRLGWQALSACCPFLFYR